MGGTSGVSASDERARRAQEAAEQRIREHEPVRLEPTTPPKPLRIGGYYVPPMSDESLRIFASAHGLPPPALADLKLYTKDLLEREVDSARARLANKPGPEGDGDRLSLTRLEGELATRSAPKLADLAKLDSLDALDREILEEQIFLRKYVSTAAPDLVHQHQQQLAALSDKRAVVFERDSVCDKAKTAYVDNLPGGRPFITLTADDLIAKLNRQLPMSVFQEDAVRKAFNSWRLDTCRSTGIDPTTVTSSKDRRLGPDRYGDQEREMQMRAEMLMASFGSASATLAFVDSALQGDTVANAHARVMAASTHSDLAASMPVRGSATTGVAPDTRVGVNHSHVDGLAQEIREEATGTGHANDTRFKRIDNRGIERDVDKVTFGPFRPNVGAPRRTPEQAREIYERATGRKLPSWIKLVEDPKVADSNFAEYSFGANRKRNDRPFDYDLESDGMVVRIRPETLDSDEAIVCTLTHEAHELETLRTMDQTADMTWGDVMRHVREVKDGEKSAPNLHQQAWDLGDMEVHLMRAKPGTPEYEGLLKLRDGMAKRFAMQNGVGP